MMHATTTLTELTCGGCGITYAIPDAYLRQLHRTHASFWCPRGCVRHFPGESDVERLQRQLRHARSRQTHLEDQRAAAERSAAAYKGHLTRARRRAAAGVCPVCQRTVRQMADHIADKHPGHLEEVPQ